MGSSWPLDAGVAVRPRRMRAARVRSVLSRSPLGKGVGRWEGKAPEGAAEPRAVLRLGNHGLASSPEGTGAWSASLEPTPGHAAGPENPSARALPRAASRAPFFAREFGPRVTDAHPPVRALRGAHSVANRYLSEPLEGPCRAELPYGQLPEPASPLAAVPRSAGWGPLGETGAPQVRVPRRSCSPGLPSSLWGPDAGPGFAPSYRAP